ncbi:hypothetical protein [Chryseobacterium sp.]|uniref:hypothetical protein n=1 Tax=Chryseobacterium sp. TaxID=1871047 RepID=UPI0028A190D4|nr:hypothetical protein [Chryseobacterium sp.]
MRRIILGFLLFLTVVINAQIKFENGYIISNNGTKQDVLIKNLAWVDNPNQITYKSSEDSKELHASPADIKEFKVDGFQKYISYDGPIEQSSYDLSNLSDDKEPVFKNDKVFLKEITSGNYKLYFYSSKRLLKFFFGSDSNIEPLVYKKYHPAGIQSQVATNEQYKTQLKTLFSTNEEAVKLIEKSRYTEESL